MEDPFADLPPTMSLSTEPGQKVRFTGRGGYDNERAMACDLLEVNRVYEIEDMRVGRFDSRVKIDGQWFNTVLFEDA